MSDVFRILHVCTGNICRSPMAEHLMRAGLEQRLGEQASVFSISSAGTWGHSGSPMEPFALNTLSAYRLEGAAFRARELVAEHVASADLVLGATREHRAAAAVLQPRATGRIFTLREFDRLVSVVHPEELPAGDRVERARALVRAAASRRGTVPPDAPGDDDVSDPYRKPEPRYVVCAQLLHTSLQRPLDLLAG